jgi:hypothetical protein
MFFLFGVAIWLASLNSRITPGPLDKVYHLSAYGMWAFAAVQAARSTRWRWIFVGIMIAVGIMVEMLQPTFGRHVSVMDALANGVGVAIGASASLWVQYQAWERQQLLRFFWPVAAVCTVAILAYAAGPMVLTHNLSNWDCDFSLAVGDEIGGGRHWQGEVFCARLMAGGHELLPFRGATPACGTPTPAAARVLLEFGTLSENGLPFAWKPWRDAATREFCQAVQQAEVLILDVWLRSDDLQQEGPARIVTFSESLLQRNFTLGQTGDALDLRIRSQATGLNGTFIPVNTGAGAVTGAMQHVTAVYRDHTVELDVEGGAHTEPVNIAISLLAFMDRGARVALLLAGTGILLVALRALCLTTYGRRANV